MKKTFTIINLLSILFLYLSCNSTSPEMHCAKFKEGKFTHKLALDGTIYLLDRNDSVQVETNTRTGNVVISKINWINSCEYEVLFQSQSITAYDSSLDFMRNRPIKARIIATGKDYYIFESRIDSFDFRYTDT